MHDDQEPAAEPAEHSHAEDHDHVQGEHAHVQGDHDHGDHVHPHPVEDHSHVGEGYVAIDIGDGYGAVILWMPESMMHVEIETRLVGSTEPPTHVMVLPRPVNDKKVPTIVFPSLPMGDYEFWVKPDGPVMLKLTVPDGAVAEGTWPDQN